VLEQLRKTEPDPMWALWASMDNDPRDTVNMVLGVYRDAFGSTPTMRAVAAAEQRLAGHGGNREYRPLSGNERFNRLVTELVLGDAALIERATTIQAVAGTGALRLLLELARGLTPTSTVWISNPGYVNHAPISQAAGLRRRTYAYLGADGRLDFDRICRDLSGATRGDVVIVQAGCHNPTGVDLSLEQWVALAELIARRGLIPLVDLAYLGFDGTPVHDASGLRALAARVDEVLVAVSGSKTFSLYRERVGAAIVLGRAMSADLLACLQNAARSNYSMPPEHGAALVAEILGDSGLRRLWATELEQMRTRLAANRRALAAELERLGAPARILALESDKGIFSVLPFDRDQMVALRAKHGVYGTDLGRINIAGMADRAIPRVAVAIVDVLSGRG